MYRWVILAILAAGLCSIRLAAPKQAPQYITERDARLIFIARVAAAESGFSLKDAVYQARPDGSGWIVQVDYAPGYSGKGEPSTVVDGTFFVKLKADEKVSEILSSSRWIKSTTQPRDGA